MNETKKLEILLIEDKVEYIAVAKQYFNTVNDVKITYATTLDELPNLNSFNGVITDLMFPYDNTGNLEPNRELVKRIGDTIREVVSNKWNDYTNLQLTTVQRDLEILEKSAVDGTVPATKSGDREGVYQSELYKIGAAKIHKDTIKEFGYEGFSKEQLEKELSKLEGNHKYDLGNTITMRQEEYAQTLLSPAEQPMGVLVIEYCVQEKIPCVLVTSGHLAHGDVTTPVYAYMQIKSLASPANPNEKIEILKDKMKTDIETWEKSLKYLRQRIDLMK